MTWLICSDLHLTDRARDAYRFKLFDWLAEKQRQHGVTATFILGDLTDRKDRHSSSLVNSIVDKLTGLKPPIFILKGNHDFIEVDNPFFGFLSNIEGVTFFTHPQYVKSLDVAFIPHIATQKALEAACACVPSTHRPEAVMCHLTLEGAIAESGRRLSGLRASPIEFLQPNWVLSGDVHKPQRCGPVTYIGAPYQIRFGDDFTPRVLLIKNGKEQNLYFPAPHKWTLTIHDSEDLFRHEDLKRGDQVKITIELAREEAIEWQTHKKRVRAACVKLGLEVYGIETKVLASKRRERIKLDGSRQLKTPRELINEYCTLEHVASNIKRVGLELIQDV